MPGTIGRVPVGLLGLLDMQAQGETPRLLDDAVRATVESFPFYASALRQNLAFSFTKVVSAGNENRYWPALNGSVAVGPKLGRLWYVRNYTLTALVSTTARFTASIQPQAFTDGTQYGLALGNLANVSAGTASFARDFWMLPGDHLGVLLENAATYALYTSLDYAEFPF